MEKPEITVVKCTVFAIYLNFITHTSEINIHFNDEMKRKPDELEYLTVWCRHLLDYK